MKRRFQERAHQKISTGEPNYLPYIHSTKRIFYKILQAVDGSTGGSDVGNDWLGSEDRGSTHTSRLIIFVLEFFEASKFKGKWTDGEQREALFLNNPKSTPTMDPISD